MCQKVCVRVCVEYNVRGDTCCDVLEKIPLSPTAIKQAQLRDSPSV